VNVLSFQLRAVCRVTLMTLKLVVIKICHKQTLNGLKFTTQVSHHTHCILQLLISDLVAEPNNTKSALKYDGYLLSVPVGYLATG